MHKFHKALLSLLLFPLALFSCGNNKYYGYYKFQLGEEKGEHFGFHMTLKNEKYTGGDDGAKEDSKIFTFGMKATKAFLPKDPGEDIPIGEDELLEYLKAKFLFVAVSLLNTEGTGHQGVSGYYNIGKKDVSDKGRPLDLNIILPVDPSIIIDKPNLKDALKKLVIAYVDGKNINAILPVSLDDIFYQLAWYGYFISFDVTTPGLDIIERINVLDLTNPEEGVYVTLPGKQGDERLDTHPTDLERGEMNSMFGPTGEHSVIGWTEGWFARDFHTLTATLIKQ